MNIIIRLAANVIAAIVAMWLHEIPKYYLTIFLTRPAYRREVKIKDIWSKSIDPIGLILLVFIKVGWQMPLKIDASKLTNKKNGLVAISMFGMMMNLMTAIFCLLADRYWLTALPNAAAYAYFSYFMVTLALYNIVIMVVNLLPVPPLDMTKIIYAISPNTYFKILQNGRMIQSVFVLFLAFGGLQMLSLPIIRRLYQMLG